VVAYQKGGHGGGAAPTRRRYDEGTMAQSGSSRCSILGSIFGTYTRKRRGGEGGYPRRVVAAETREWWWCLLEQWGLGQAVKTLLK
jgi:hypothetical protein